MRLLDAHRARRRRGCLFCRRLPRSRGRDSPRWRSLLRADMAAALATSFAIAIPAALLAVALAVALAVSARALRMRAASALRAPP